MCYLGWGSLAVIGLIDASECIPTFGAGVCESSSTHTAWLRLHFYNPFFPSSKVLLCDFSHIADPGKSVLNVQRCILMYVCLRLRRRPRLHQWRVQGAEQQGGPSEFAGM